MSDLKLHYYHCAPRITKDMIYLSPRPRDAKGRFLPYRELQRKVMEEALLNLGKVTEVE